MARYHLSDAAIQDITQILRTSGALHGAAARTRYRSLITAALRRIGAEPEGPLTHDRSEFFAGIRSLHIRRCKSECREAPVGDPVHIIFYRYGRSEADKPVSFEIVRVLHERMGPSLQLI